MVNSQFPRTYEVVLDDQRVPLLDVSTQAPTDENTRAPAPAAKGMKHDGQEMLIGDVKDAKMAWIEPVQRQRTFEFQFQFQLHAMSVANELCILDAFVFRSADDHDDEDDGNLSQHLNDLVKGVIERETRALAASVTMAEIILRGASSSSSMDLLGNMQVEVKHLGRFILYDAYIYVKPQFVKNMLSKRSMAEELERERRGHRQDANRTRQTEMVLLNVEADQLPQAADAFPSQGQQEVEISAEDGSKQEEESIERDSKIDEIMACQSPQPLIPQVIYSNDNTTGHLEWQKKSWPSYTLNTLLFACSMLFSAYMDLSSSTSITIKILLVVDIVIFIVINAVHQIKLPNWGNVLTIISWLLLELAMCLLILPRNGCYALAILSVLSLVVVVALLQLKFQHLVKKYVLPSFTTDDDDTPDDIGDQENHYLNHLFDISNGIVTLGGMVTGILGYYSYMEGPVTAAGFFFFSTVLLGLYLMMVIVMRAVSPPHAACLAIVLKALLLLTVITASISFVRHSMTM